MSADQPSHNRKNDPTVKDGGESTESVDGSLKAARTIRDSLAGDQAEAQGVSAALIPSRWPIIRLYSQAGSEADIYLIDYQGREAVLRLYRLGQKPKPEVFSQLTEISQNMGSLMVEVFETGQDEETNRWYEVQEYIPHGSLAHLMNERASSQTGFSETEFEALVNQMTEALSRLHKNHLIHRDIKPDNILLRSREPLNIALTDFGIASQLAIDIARKATKSAHTIPYAAPEAFSDQAGKAGDWWSMGVILLEITLGRHPYDNFSNEKVKGDIMSQGMPVPDGIPFDTALLLKGLLTRDYRPEKRWGGEQVQKWLAGERSIPVFFETAQPAKESSLQFNGENYSSLAELAEAFAQGKSWEKGEAMLGRGHIREWLENNSRNDEALDVERLPSGRPGVSSFAFILKFNPALGPVYKGLPLTFGAIVSYIFGSDQSEAQVSFVNELTNGELAELPKLAEEAGQPLNKLTATLLRFGHGEPKDLGNAIRASDNPDDFLWGRHGAPGAGGKAARLEFALKAGTPLLSVDWWQKRIPRQAVLPEEIISGLGEPATYRAAREKLEQLFRKELLETAPNALSRLLSNASLKAVTLPGLDSAVYASSLSFEDYCLNRKKRLEEEPKEKSKRKKRVAWASGLGVLACLSLILYAFWPDISKTIDEKREQIRIEAAAKAEEEAQRQQREFRRQAEFQRQQEEAQRQEQLRRQQQDAQRLEQLRLQQAEAQRQEQLRRQQEETQRQAELRRQQEEAQRQEQLRRQQEEARRQERFRLQRAEAERQEQLRRQQEEYRRQEQLRRQQDEAQRQAELRRQQAEARREQERERRQAERERQINDALTRGIKQGLDKIFK